MTRRRVALFLMGLLVLALAAGALRHALTQPRRQVERAFPEATLFAPP